jgi:hypothetical protein
MNSRKKFMPDESKEAILKPLRQRAAPPVESKKDPADPSITKEAILKRFKFNAILDEDEKTWQAERIEALRALKNSSSTKSVVDIAPTAEGQAWLKGLKDSSKLRTPGSVFDPNSNPGVSSPWFGKKDSRKRGPNFAKFEEPGYKLKPEDVEPFQLNPWNKRPKKGKNLYKRGGSRKQRYYRRLKRSRVDIGVTLALHEQQSNETNIFAYRFKRKPIIAYLMYGAIVAHAVENALLEAYPAPMDDHNESQALIEHKHFIPKEIYTPEFIAERVRLFEYNTPNVTIDDINKYKTSMMLLAETMPSAEQKAEAAEAARLQAVASYEKLPMKVHAHHSTRKGFVFHFYRGNMNCPCLQRRSLRRAIKVVDRNEPQSPIVMEILKKANLKKDGQKIMSTIKFPPDVHTEGFDEFREYLQTDHAANYFSPKELERQRKEDELKHKRRGIDE